MQKRPVVYDYELIRINGKDYINSITEKPLKGNEGLINNPVPLPEMMSTIEWPMDEFGNLQYVLDGNIISLFPQTPAEDRVAEITFNKVALFKIIKALIAGIENGQTDPKFIKLRNVVARIQNGDIQ